MSDWYQQALTPPEVLECNLRIGLIPVQGHAQALVEMRDPITNVLVAQWSNPHVHSDNWQELLKAATDKMAQYIGDHVNPF